MSGKGSTRRPSQVPEEQIAEAFARIFGLKKICGRKNDGHQCQSSKGTKCPDCGVALHDVGAEE